MGVTQFQLQHSIGRSDLPKMPKIVLRTLLSWADVGQWDLYASNATIAGYVPCDRRTVQRALRELQEGGWIVALPDSPRSTNRWQIQADRIVATWPPPARKGRQKATGGVAASPPPSGPTPQGGGSEPQGGRQGATQTNHLPNQETSQRKNHTTAADAFIRLVGSDELLTHPNATPERLEWVVREARSETNPKRNPGGWAAGAIREGYPVPPRSRESLREERREKREAALATYRAMGREEQGALKARALARYPNLDPEKPDHQISILGAVAKIIMEEPE